MKAIPSKEVKTLVWTLTYSECEQHNVEEPVHGNSKFRPCGLRRGIPGKHDEFLGVVVREYGQRTQHRSKRERREEEHNGHDRKEVVGVAPCKIERSSLEPFIGLALVKWTRVHIGFDALSLGMP